MTSAPISDLRLARLFTWARLWLEWAAVYALAFCGARELRRRLLQMRRGVASLILLRASARVTPPPARTRHGPPRKRRSGSVRRVVGSDLRRALTGRGIAGRFAALLRVLRDPEPFIVKLARRLARGFTRLTHVIPAARTSFTLHTGAPGSAPQSADTS